jgi:hypothetical protein
VRGVCFRHHHDENLDDHQLDIVHGDGCHDLAGPWVMVAARDDPIKLPKKRVKKGDHNCNKTRLLKHLPKCFYQCGGGNPDDRQCDMVHSDCCRDLAGDQLERSSSRM